VHSGYGSSFKNEANHAIYRFGSEAMTLRLSAQANPNLRSTFIVRNVYSNVANKQISGKIRDSELTPLARLKKQRGVHFSEEGGSFGIGHWRPALVPTDFGVIAILLECCKVTSCEPS
jgi:hypothetical protein